MCVLREKAYCSLLITNGTLYLESMDEGIEGS